MTDIDALEVEYSERLAKRAVTWQARHPDDAKLIREEVSARFRRAGTPDPEPDTFAWQMIEAAVVEAIRIRNKWPTVRQWRDLQPVIAAHDPSPYREVIDHKSLAAGDS